MKTLLIRWVLLVISLVISAALTGLLLPGQFVVDLRSISDFLMLMFGVAVLTFVNATLGSLIKLLTLPLTCLTLGIFSLVINAAMLFIVGQLNYGFHIKGFLAAFVGSILLSAANGFLGAFVPEKDDKK